MTSIVHSAVCLGLNVHPVTIEAALGSGFSGVQLIGVPQDYARDARERIRSALESLGFQLPARRLVVSFSPIDTLKQFKGGLEHLDLPCAIVILAALSKHTSTEKNHLELLRKLSLQLQTGHHVFAGQLTLSGHLLPPIHSLPFELFLLESKDTHPILWSACAESQLKRVEKNSFVKTHSLRDCIEKIIHFSNQENTNEDLQTTRSGLCLTEENPAPQHGELHSQAALKRVLDKFIHMPEVAIALAMAAAGRHHILLAGSPGCGKTYALRHLKDLLPLTSKQEQLEVALIHQRDPCGSGLRPVRSPHHSSSAAALLGGSLLQPGEVSLAHHGLLFLDELAEFPRPALEALREPLDEKRITLSRSRGRIELPANFLLAAATNPCACGYFFSTVRACRCVGHSPLKYQQKLSGPLLERFSILLLMDEILPFHESGTDRTDTPLSQLAQHWREHFLESPFEWISLFISVRHRSWLNPPESKLNASSSAEFEKVLEQRCKEQRLSARAQKRLTELTATAVQLFPKPAHHWKSEKFIQAIEQLRGFETAIRKGVSFLTPDPTANRLKENLHSHDTSFRMSQAERFTVREVRFDGENNTCG